MQNEPNNFWHRLNRWLCAWVCLLLEACCEKKENDDNKTDGENWMHTDDYKRAIEKRGGL